MKSKRMKNGTGMITEMEYRIFRLLFFSSFFMFGLFHEYISCIYCSLLGILYAVMSIRRKRMVFYWNLPSLSVCVIVFMYFIVCFYAVDTGMAWIGFMKKLTILFFLCVAMQMEEKERDTLLGLVPLIGSVMVVVGVLGGLVEPGRYFFYMSERLGGFFQYPNVFALFCLLGIILLSIHSSKGAENRWKLIQMFLLIVGIFLSGSRTILLFLLLVCLIQGIRKREWRIPMAVIFAVMLVAAGVYVAVTGNVQSLGRLFTVSLASETFLERLLCMKDGFRLLITHPFGLGYLGYYYMEPGIQTGAYSVRYVHNDVLQMALDIGVIPAVIFLGALANSIFCGGRQFEKRLAVAVIGAHCLLEFDLEFISVWFLLLLLADGYRGRKINIAAGGKLAFYKVLAVVLSWGGLYVGIAMLPRYFGHTETAATMLPFYTEAKKDILFQETNSIRAEKLAENLLQQNAYIAEAYDVLAAAAYQRGDWREMAKCRKELLRCRRYGATGYKNSVIMLSHAIENVGKTGEKELGKELMQEVLEVEKMLEETKKKTDPAAYRLHTKPDFELGEEVADYVRQIHQLMKL